MNSTDTCFGKMQSIPIERFFGHKDPLASNRKEYKFLVPMVHLETVLDFLADDYYFCNKGDECIFRYNNTYFDTLDYTFFKHHRQGRFNRIKIRTREYSDLVTETYVECKMKVRGSKTRKKRVQRTGFDSGLDYDFVHENLDKYGLKVADLKSQTNIRYNRMFLTSKAFDQRITIDLNIYAKKFGGVGREVLPRHFVLEVKSSKIPKEMTRFLKSVLKVRRTGFSKYCVSLCLLDESLRRNKWKQILKRYC